MGTAGASITSISNDGSVSLSSAVSLAARRVLRILVESARLGAWNRVRTSRVRPWSFVLAGDMVRGSGAEYEVEHGGICGVGEGIGGWMRAMVR